MRNIGRTIAVSRDARGGVVLLHGIGVGAWTLRRLERALRQGGYATLNLGYASRCKPLEALVEDIHPGIADFAARCDGPIHFVAHSMGGLLTRLYVATHRPERLGRVVMLGTPNGGSEIADRLKHFGVYRAWFGPAGQLVTQRDAAVAAMFPPVDYPVGIIAGNRSVYSIRSAFLPKPHDGKVSVENTKLDGMADHIVMETSHPWLVRNGPAIEQTIVFLRDGEFRRS